MGIFVYILFLILVVFLALILLSAIIYIFYNLKAKNLDKQLDNIDNPFSTVYENYIIKDPYNVKGDYHKAQLHTHTKKSDGKLSPEKLVEGYKRRGYSFLAITDHNKITRYNDFDDDTFITITGEEMTWIRPFWPLGQHILRLFVKERIRYKNLQHIVDYTGKTGLIVINHPSSLSGLGTQYWELERLLNLKNIHFIEIVNHYSEEEKNIKYWHQLLKKFGPDKPVWGIASDDAHVEEDIDKEWLMVKVENISEKALYDALIRGAFYLSQGPGLDFSVNGKNIIIISDQLLEGVFIDADHNIRKKISGRDFTYYVKGDEGFIRFEGSNPDTGKKAWSQAFWLIQV